MAKDKDKKPDDIEKINKDDKLIDKLGGKGGASDADVKGDKAAEALRALRDDVDKG